MHFLHGRVRLNQTPGSNRACSFSCCLQEEQGGVHPFDEARKQVISL
jgi:hypothetical protein